jgi:hypothetical protein
MFSILYNCLPPKKALQLNFIIEAEIERNSSSTLPEMATSSNDLETLEENPKEVETRKEEKQVAHEETIATEKTEEELNTSKKGGDKLFLIGVTSCDHFDTNNQIFYTIGLFKKYLFKKGGGC